MRSLALLFAGVLLPGFAAASNLTANASEYENVYVIPQEENATCPSGDEIQCGSVIDTNGTILRYERGNLTTPITGTVPSEQCPWMIRAPLGTRILFQTSCYYHYHNNYSADLTVCFKFASEDNSRKICGHGYDQQHYSRENEENFSIYYESGEAFAMGFTSQITFIGDPVAVMSTTTSTPESTSSTSSTTSDGVLCKANFAFVSIALMVYSVVMSR